MHVNCSLTRSSKHQRFPRAAVFTFTGLRISPVRFGLLSTNMAFLVLLLLLFVCFSFFFSFFLPSTFVVNFSPDASSLHHFTFKSVDLLFPLPLRHK